MVAPSKLSNGKYMCHKCDKVFSRESHLKSHLTQQENPCDLICPKCGKKSTCRSVYNRHKNVCTGKTYTLEEIEATKINKANVGSVNGQNAVTVVVGDHNNVSNNNNNMSFTMNVKFDTPNKEALMRRGMTPHGVEAGSLFSLHNVTLCNMINEYMDNHLRRKTVNEKTKHQLVMNMIMLFYSNQEYPENINIMDDEPAAPNNKIYSGQEFVPDIMTKDVRNRRILQILLSTLSKLLKENIQTEIKTFINKELIPHIIVNYFKDGYHESLQYVWEKNVEFVKELDVKKTPPYSLTLGRYNHSLTLEEEIRLCKKEHDEMLKIYNKRFDDGIDNAFKVLNQRKEEERRAALFNTFGSLIANNMRVEEPDDKDLPVASVTYLDTPQQPNNEEQSNNSLSPITEPSPMEEQLPILQEPNVEEQHRELVERTRVEILTKDGIFKQNKPEDWDLNK